MLEVHLYIFFLHFIAWISFLFCFRWLWKLAGISLVVQVSLAFAFFLSVLSAKSNSINYSSSIFEIAFLQVCKGLGAGVPFAIALEFFPFAGRMSDISRGTQFAEQSLGGIASRVSLLEGFAEMAILLILLPLGVIDGVLLDLFRLFTFNNLPQQMAVDWFETLIRVSAESFLLGLLLAVPIVFCGLLLDLSICLMSRNISRINLSFELMGLRACCGLLLFSILIYAQIEPVAAFLEEVSAFALGSDYGVK